MTIDDHPPRIGTVTVPRLSAWKAWKLQLQVMSLVEIVGIRWFFKVQKEGTPETSENMVPLVFFAIFIERYTLW